MRREVANLEVLPEQYGKRQARQMADTRFSRGDCGRSSERGELFEALDSLMLMLKVNGKWSPEDFIRFDGREINAVVVGALGL